jgi:DNA repair protein RadC
VVEFLSAFRAGGSRGTEDLVDESGSSARAPALIPARNHPSGGTHPSEGEIEATKCVAKAAQAHDIRIHDQLIVARPGWSSLRTLGLI